MESYQTKFINHYLRPYLSDTPKKKYTLAGLSILTVILFGLLGIYPALKSAVTTYGVLRQGQHYSQQLDIKIAALKSAEELQVRYAPQIKLLPKDQGHDQVTGQIIEEITTLAETSGVSFDFYQKEIAGADQLKHLRFWVGLKGNLPGILNFLRNVKVVDPLLQIESAAINQEKILTATVLLRRY